MMFIKVLDSFANKEMMPHKIVYTLKISELPSKMVIDLALIFYLA